VACREEIVSSSAPIDSLPAFIFPCRLLNAVWNTSRVSERECEKRDNAATKQPNDPSKPERNQLAMKNVATSILAGALIILFISWGCNKNDSSTNPPTNQLQGTASFTLNGAGFTNQSFSISGFLGGYSTSDKMTALAGSSATTGDSTTLSIVFPGSATGTFQFTDTSGVVISRGTVSSTRVFVNRIGGGQIVVTSYGAVSGSIAGTFSGKLYEVTKQTLDSVTVSNGSFNAMRVH